MIWFGWVLWHINHCRLFNAKAIFVDEQQWYYFTHSWEDKEVHTFPKSIRLKVNVVARLSFKHTLYDSAVHCVNHCTRRISSAIV